ncbi:MAG TPA: hypothetical protein VMT10_15080 [Solirubrobacteraceae bacterium]|nr:hypothetical protein [Solirubrobacteraceae bacterium]
MARKLAIGVTRARTPTARYNALLAVMRTLHVGVFTGNGKALVRAGRPHEVYLYDFEVKEMAGALGRGQTITVADLANRLGAGGLKPHGQPLTADQLAQTLASGTRAAGKRPREPLSLVPLLARQLGLRHRPAYDLATAAAGKVGLDALQTFLIGVDVAVAAYGGGGGTSSRSFAAAAGHAPSATAAGACDGDTKDLVKEFMPFGKWGIGLIKAVSTPVKGIAITLDAIHGPILAFSVDVRSAVSEDRHHTHLGPAGHDLDAGRPLGFRVYVIMQDQIREGVIKCGPLVGVKFPDAGPIPGVRVLWNVADPTPSHLLDNFGSKSYSGDKTDANGIVDLHFAPRDEKLPGFGSVHEAGNTENAVALYQSAFGNVPGTLAQFLIPKIVSFPWTVSYHLPRGFKFAGTVNYGYNNGRQLDFDMHVCGGDPFGAPWTGTYTYHDPGLGTVQAIWPFLPGFSTSPNRGQIDGQLSLTDPFSVRLQLESEGQSDQRSLPLEEDQSCPDNAE